jgi:predicted nuclease of predicted toxin-antitoxin system
VKFLADMGVSVSTIASLREAGHDSVHLRDEGLIRMEDADILGKARSERRVVLTFDLDFGDLLAASGANLPSAIIFRLRNQTPSSVRQGFLRFFPTARPTSTAVRSLSSRKPDTEFAGFQFRDPWQTRSAVRTR